MMSRPETSVVVVTGASSGVGRAIARAFGAQRAKVALIARNEEALDAAADEIRRAGGTAMVLPLDVADAEAVEAAAARVEAAWNRIDVWVNCAMTTVFAPSSSPHPTSSGASPRSRTSATSTGRWPHSSGCALAIGARSYRSAPPWRTGRFRSRAPTVLPRPPFAASPTRCGPS